MAKKQNDNDRLISIVLAVLGFGWIGAKMRGYKHWSAMLVLWIIGWVTMILLIGILFLFIAYVWGIMVCVEK